jgi:hypothetical protein
MTEEARHLIIAAAAITLLCLYGFIAYRQRRP